MRKVHQLTTALTRDVEAQMLLRSDEEKLIVWSGYGLVMGLGQQAPVDHDQTLETWRRVKLVEMGGKEVLDTETVIYQLVDAYCQTQETPGCDHASEVPNQIWHYWQEMDSACAYVSPADPVESQSVDLDDLRKVFELVIDDGWRLGNGMAKWTAFYRVLS